MPLVFDPDMKLVDQEGLAAVFGNGLSTACVVNIGAQVTSIVCIEVSKIKFICLFYLLLCTRQLVRNWV